MTDPFEKAPPPGSATPPAPSPPPGYGAPVPSGFTPYPAGPGPIGKVRGTGFTIFLFFILSQFVAYFTYTNIGTILALKLSGVLTAANIGVLPLLIGFIIVVAIIDLLLTGAIAKWAIFAPVFVPLLMKLGVEPEAVLAAYRVADSPMNAITPLNAYFALVVGYTMKYEKKSGVGTVVSLMLPYVGLMFLLWTALFILWQSLGLPWGV